MKKVILALAIVSVSFAACNNGDKKEETPATDTAAVAPVKVDTAAVKAVVDTAVKMVVDTTKKK
jgi:uncharacterized protein involved in high-affinity Fe2+ transport